MEWTRRRPRLVASAYWLGTILFAAIVFQMIRIAREDTPPPVRIANRTGDPYNARSRGGNRLLHDLLNLPDADFEKLDVVELNLAIVREIPACGQLDVARYRRTVDGWAERVKEETNRHWYRFERNPADYENSTGYFCALVMCTVIGQDFNVRYDLEDFSFEQPEDLFVHGVIDKRKGTCVSLPILYVAIGQRLGWPIRAVAVPGHAFCPWDDPETGERLNIEAANLGGLTEHDDEYYRHWPYEIDPRWEREHHVLKSLTMREHASVMVGALGAYFLARRDASSALRWDALAHWLDPANRSAFVVLRKSIDLLSPRYLDADELAGRTDYARLTPHPSLAARQTAANSPTKEALEPVPSSDPSGVIP